MPTSRKAQSARKTQGQVKQGAVAPQSLEAAFPRIRLPIKPPYPPMEAKQVDEIPAEGGYLFEHKWDGFRCLVFRSGKTTVLQSKAGNRLAAISRN